MSKAHPPELKKYMDKKLTWEHYLCAKTCNKYNKRLVFKTLQLEIFLYHFCAVKLNGGRTINGFLRGFDPFMNMVIDETVEECKDVTQKPIGMVVVRGNSVVLLESLDRIY